MNIPVIKLIPPSIIDGKTYYADTDGNIRNAKGKILKPRLGPAARNHKGGSCYPQVDIANKNRHIHLLVCTTFWGGPMPGQQCHHLDGNKFNNRPDNLIWLFPDDHRRFDKLVKQGIIYKHEDSMELDFTNHREF